MDSFDDPVRGINDKNIINPHRGMIGIPKILSEDKKYS
jgi:hypothetical protein